VICMNPQGDFIIAHCGGFHSFFNTLIKAVNLVAKLLGHRIRWCGFDFCGTLSVHSGLLSVSGGRLATKFDVTTASTISCHRA